MFSFQAMFVLLSVVSTQLPAIGQKNPPAFRAIALRLTREFSSTKPLDSLHCLSQDGLKITDRYLLTSDLYNKKITSLLNPTGSLTPHRIAEDQYQIDPSDMSDTQYKSLIDQVRRLVSHNIADNPHWITISRTAHDKWLNRSLGPAVVGKVAAGTYWYLYLREEHGKWKIWKFELDE